MKIRTFIQMGVLSAGVGWVTMLMAVACIMAHFAVVKRRISERNVSIIGRRGEKKKFTKNKNITTLSIPFY